MLVASDSLVLSFLWLYKFTGIPWGHVEYCVIAYETVMFSVLSIKPHVGGGYHMKNAPENPGAHLLTENNCDYGMHK